MNAVNRLRAVVTSILEKIEAIEAVTPPTVPAKLIASLRGP
jgi:hypothetical protein